MPSLALQEAAVAREHVVGGEAGEDDGLDVLGLPAGLVERAARGRRRASSALPSPGLDPVALLDAGALDDPLVGGVHELASAPRW